MLARAICARVTIIELSSQIYVITIEPMLHFSVVGTVDDEGKCYGRECKRYVAFMDVGTMNSVDRDFKAFD